MGSGFPQPLNQPFHPLRDTDAWRPPGDMLEFAGVGDIVALIAGAPTIEFHRWFATEKLSDQIEQLEEADGVAGSAADVERLPCLCAHVPLRKQESIDQILHAQDVAHLAAI